MQSTY
jgi:Signal transduction histidine kinase regulating citrate/malate metabolism